MSGSPRRHDVQALFDLLLGVSGAVVLFAMMLLTTADVVLRYLFNAPLRGAFEITELMLVVLIFSGLPLVSRHDTHVTTDFIDGLLPPGARRLLATAIHLLVGVLMLGVAWLVWQRAGKMAETGDITAALHIPISPFVYMMSALLLITAVIHFIKAMRREFTQGAGGNV